MEQKFISFEDALEKLGVSSDRLNELREHGQVRAYRDGASWKFRSDEIESMVVEGVPDLPPPSNIGLIDSQQLVEAEPLEPEDDALELELVDESDSSKDLGQDDSQMEPELDDTDPVSQASELELPEMGDTVKAETSDLELDLPDEPSDPSDSILLSEEELGESVSGSLSTIIGKSELEAAEADLELAPEDGVEEVVDDSLAQGGGASDVLSSGIAGSGVLDELTEDSAGMSAFEDLEELEIDLSAESSRILSPEDVKAVKSASEPPAASVADSDLTLDEDPLLAADEADPVSTDVPLEELEGAKAVVEEGSESELELVGDGDLLLDDPSGSDITLGSGDSGINLVSPADSGLALDDIPLEMGGSAILSMLSQEGPDSEISLIASESDTPSQAEAALQTDDDFQLTPLSEGAEDASMDSSSQVIALDAEIDDLGEASLGGLDEVSFAEEADAGVVLSEDFGDAAADDLGMDYVETGLVSSSAGAEQPYTTWNIVLLSSCGIVLLLAGTMGIDLVRNMWGWNENLAINSSLMDAILELLP
ncbi:MAG: hypothetical protein MK171_10045 [Pirellulales bacterium]|nr:hypothetical protein [Pirellulales bacterium]